MAKDGLGTIITLGIVGVGGYWLYSSGMLNSLFGTTAPVTTPPVTNPPPAGGTNPVPTTPPVVTVPAPPPACKPAGILAPLLASVQSAQGTAGKTFGPNLPGTLTIDEWDYYLNQLCSGMADQYKITADTLFPGDAARGGPLNWSAFAGYAQQAGLSAYRGLGARRRVARRRPVMIGTHPVRRVA